MARIGSRVSAHREERLAANPELKAAYDRLGPRYAVVEQLIKSRQARKMTQTELAARMGVSQGVVSRMESGNHTPQLETVYDAARAMGYRVEVRLVRDRGSAPR